ncbi:MULTISPECIES: hypothetical protein [Trichocoleus]|uniref:Uncharacterized protein n=1 Tax=Trichocoleus desertorum GB2-A4 TaxID=2933944 RepID=A0ABV0J3Z8_9CYAN|nr:hypothetical protein [Trichocoleus sp. FACHB-46]MBD1861847.1 hypothetical protein [Trichocoleus sp. FACHB-46]
MLRLFTVCCFAKKRNIAIVALPALVLFALMQPSDRYIPSNPAACTSVGELDVSKPKANLEFFRNATA